jgi:hypothetical protein
MFVHKKRIPFRPGMRPEAEFAGNGKCISTDCLAGALLYVQLCPASTALCFANFTGARPGLSRKDGEARLSRAAIDFCLATPKRSRHSTGE